MSGGTRIGLLVPALDQGGGVPAVARFIKDTALRHGGIKLKLVSLCMSSADPCSVSILQPHTWRRGVCVREGIWEGTPFTHFGAMLGELEFQRYRRRRALGELLADCDLIQVVCGTPAWAHAALGLGKPVALQVATRTRIERRRRDASGRGLSARWRRGMTVITDRMDDRALQAVDAIQVENRWMLDYARKLNQDRDVDIRYAPPGVDAEFFMPVSARNDGREPYVLCVGRLEDPRKNATLLAQAWRLLPPELRRDVRLVLAGSSAPPRAFWQVADVGGFRDRIEFILHPDAACLRRLYQGAAAFALPSDEEGFGVVVIEAMACGIPVVATRCGGPDDIISDGLDGFLVPRDDAASMATHLARLLQDQELNARMGRAARSTVEDRFAEQAAGVTFIDVWQRLLARQEGA